MCNMHVHQFWWAWSLLVLEIPLPSKTAKFPFLTMDYSPWSSKNLIDPESAQKIHASMRWCNMHVHQFWWVWTSPVSEILLPSKTAKFPFLTMDYSPWSSKNLIDRNRLKKFIQVGIDVKCMHTNFGGRGPLFGFGDTWYPQKRPNFPFWPWTIVHGHQKI